MFLIVRHLVLAEGNIALHSLVTSLDQVHPYFVWPFLKVMQMRYTSASIFLFEWALARIVVDSWEIDDNLYSNHSYSTTPFRTCCESMRAKKISVGMLSLLSRSLFFVLSGIYDLMRLNAL